MPNRPPVVPCHYHLSKETWAEVVEAYRSGATARELAVKWKVSPGSIYYQAGRAGWSKKRNGDQMAREHAKAVEAAEAARAEPARREQRALKNLFAPAPVDDPEAVDPAALARAATLASGRAMKARLWNEARALAGLAESYARLGERARGGGQTIETMDLGLMFEVLADDNGVAARRLALNPDRVDDPDRAIKEEYQRRLAEVRQTRTHHAMAMVRRIHAAERQIRKLGGEVEVSQSSFDAMAGTRDWLLEATRELEDVTVTPSPPPGDPWKVGM
jgi:hypothetical protein